MINNETTISENQQALPRLTLDMAKYVHFLDESQLSEDEKHEFLQIMWDIVCEFVLMGFGMNTVQQVIEGICDPENCLAEESFATLDSNHTHAVRAFVDAQNDMTT